MKVPKIALIIIIIVIGIAASAAYIFQSGKQLIPVTSLPTGITPTSLPPTITQYRIIIATGGIGGVYYYYGATVAGIISNYTDIPATSVQTAASIDNLLLIRDRSDIKNGIIYCAIVTPDGAYVAYTGQHERFKNATAPISILWAVYPSYYHIITTSATGIKNLQDLKGKRVSIGAPGSTTELQALQILKLAGIDPARDFAKVERLGAEESAKALLDGTIDAYFWLAGIPTGSVVELSNSLRSRGMKIVLLDIPDYIINEITKLYPGVAPGIIPKDIYGTDKDIKTISYWNLFVCHKDLPAEVGYKITKAVFEHIDLIYKSVPAAKEMNLSNAVKFVGGIIPYNDGALRYFREVGALK